MKTLILLLISVYQGLISPILKQILGVKSQCRYSPTCSAYAKIVISKHGVIRGSSLALKRLLQCQPFAKSYGHI